MADTFIIVVKRGMVQEVYSLNPCQTEIEIIDLDCNGSDPNAEYEAMERLKAVRKCLYKLY